MDSLSPAYREPTREDLAPLLLRRYRLIAAPLLIGTFAFAALHLLFDERRLGLLLALKGLQAAVTVGGLWLSTKRPTYRVVVLSLLTLSMVVNFVTAITGMVIGNVHTNSLLFVVTALATSSFFPWGAGIQTASVIAAAGAALGPLLGEPALYQQVWYDLVALAVAFSISIYIAGEVENDTLAEVRARAASRALAESRADFEGVFRSSNVLLALLERRGDEFFYADANPALAALFGWTPDEMRGKSGRDLGFDDDGIAEWLAVLDRCAREGSAYVPEYCLRVVRPERWFTVHFSAIRDGTGPVVRFSGVAVEITELRRATQAVQRLNLDLEAQVRERTALLEAANKDLESFAYSVSHDLRTPLRTIEGFAALLEADHGTELSGEAIEQLERIRGASRHMSRLIDDMLMLSRASRVELRREPVDLTMLARSIAGELRGAAPDRDVAVEIEPGLVANADPHLARIVLTNLLGNAWKYTGNRPRAHVHVGTELHEGESVFFVRDDGCGFDMRFVGKLFQPFQRLHAPDQFEGTGVGLATVARIVRRHGGKVWAEGEIDRGATMRFTLGESAIVNPS